ncbi:SusE domain-containing protein [Epilithonimonas vandammei]|jgi:hypothetical protein|uniref:SusF/SusE family outer membrane protein n=1 Tax=Epilithonimonas vandammei TaxID=2487072 RepID=A0A3G8YEE5_9FLAO|nr:SusE domain-containing protein [Epilithonimonas vandammei]AZI40844.1 SusF/SusE family outer membrane protein [Epilithonimonas vandammei]
MKNIFKFLFVSFIASLLFSCEKDEDRAVIGNVTEGLLRSDKTDLTLAQENADQTAVTLSWDDPSYGPNLALSNQLEIALEGTDFQNAKAVDLAAGSSSISYTVQDFNALLLNAGANAGETEKFELRLKSSAGASIPETYSPVIKMTVKTYALISYLYVPGAYQQWNPATANTLVSATSNGIYVTYIDFTAAGSEFKITVERNWDNSYGTDDNVNLIYNGGGNMKAANAGPQKLSVNLNTKKFTLIPYSMGLVGDATANGWNGPDTRMSWDDANLSWSITTSLAAGNFKFRVNNDWSENYGGSNGSASSGGDNIAVAEAGTYKITFDPFKLSYTVTKQ